MHDCTDIHDFMLVLVTLGHWFLKAAACCSHVSVILPFSLHRMSGFVKNASAASGSVPRTHVVPSFAQLFLG